MSASAPPACRRPLSPLVSLAVASLVALGFVRPAAAAPPASEPPALSSVRGRIRIGGARTSELAVVSLRAPGVKPAPPAEPVPILQKGFRFQPHVVVIQTGTAVRFVNEDPEPHNVYSPEGRYNLGVWPTGETKDFVFKTPGVYSQRCNIHPDTPAFVVVVDTPHFALTDERGGFAIEGVPPGKYLLSVWREPKGGLERAVVVEPATPLTLELVVDR